MARAASAPIVTELLLKCSDGVTIAAQSWKSPGKPVDKKANTTTTERILCLHGWMDNCRSFHYLAPSIVQALPHVELVALDFPGHGMSGHKSVDGPSLLLSELVYYVAEAAEQLNWISSDAKGDREGSSSQQQQFTIVGHSMGAAVGCVYSAAFPEHVDRLVLVEGGGPLARKGHDIAKHVRQHVKKRMVGNAHPKEPRVYPSLEKAVQTRCFTAKNFPGNQWLSTEASTELVLRGSVPVEGSDSGALKFRHDPRLLWPSLQYFTPEQVDAVFDDVQCPTALILAEDGWPFDEDRAKATVERLKPVVYTTLPGSHHFHADPETADRVAEEVISFLSLLSE
uniref:AB hydrolase-1 domain-containing protein n=1 Tax=Amphora coffeiformis TaxID=265554 RepID=A0A7S3L5U5_9STRA